MEHTTFTVKGMKCEHCEARVEQALKNTDGVAHAKADHAKCTVEVDYDPAAVTPTDIMDRIEDCGYEASL